MALAKNPTITPSVSAVTSSRQLMNNVADICARNNCDPFEILCRIAMADYEYLGLQSANKPISPTVRMMAASELCHYLAPTFKNAEVREEGRQVNVIFNMGPPPS